MSEFLTNMFNLEEKVVALTGAGGHVVGGIARGLAQAGMKVVALDWNLDHAERTVAEIRESGGDAVAVKLDVRSKSDFESALQSILKKYGDLHCVLNGAGINAPTPFLEITMEEWHNILEIQLTGTMLSCQVFGGYLVKKQSGAIVNISSASSGPPLSKAFTYSVAKAGVTNLSQNLAREWGTIGVRVNVLRPGFFPTEWNRKNFITPEREQAILTHTPMKRFGDPIELVGAVFWLFSDAASFVTGAEICVDGGFTAMTI